MDQKTNKDVNTDPQKINLDVHIDGDKNYIADIITYKNYDIAEIKEKWKQHSVKIMEHLEQKQSIFCRVIKAYLSNCDKYANSKQTLLSALHKAFKYRGEVCKRKRPQANRESRKHISVQPTTTVRRNTAMGEKIAICSGSKSNQLKIARKAPHSLAACVENNVSLEGNKSKKRMTEMNEMNA